MCFQKRLPILFELSFVLLTAFMILFSGCSAPVKYETKTALDPNGYSYEYVMNDPAKARIYTLDNGMKVFLSYNADEPRISTLIGVRAGSTSDPVETTGLAHYFEHMMFKGTDDIGTLDWDSEKELLDQISDLFEAHRATTDPELKKSIYRSIDSLSQLAASFVAPNEYDKLISSLGAKRTNAGTSYESTVYINDIPSNEFEKWLRLESERFEDIVLRLLHTELETVYEEFNGYQDMDRTRSSNALFKGLFPNHPYGRDVIGLPEHLKNPSMVNIYKFAETWYRPNNMAMAIAGDIDMDEAILLIDKYFGAMEPNPDLPVIEQPVEDPIDGPIVREVVGPDAESLSLAYRFAGDNTSDHKHVTLISSILSNSQAGLIDLELNQKQKVLRAGSYAYFMRDYGIHNFYGQPREGQSLEEVKDLLLEQLEKIKNGDFEDWMIDAIINDMRLSEIKREESNFARVYGYIDVFIKGKTYAEKLAFIDELEKITKEDIIEFAKTNYGDNYVVVYKRTGENIDLVKVEKPVITPLEINRNDQSAYFKEFMVEESESIQPVFVDFDTEIKKGSLESGVEISYIQNKTNDLFELQYIIDMGKNHNPMLPLAFNYLPYLGTDLYSAEDLQKEFYRFGLSMSVYASSNRCYVSVSGLGKSFEKGVEMLEHVVANAQPDPVAYNDYVDGILKKRTDAKLNKGTIMWSGLFNYVKYGADNPFTNIISSEDLKKVNPQELTDLMKDIYAYKHRMFYYGKNDLAEASKVIDKFHVVPGELREYPEPVKYIELETTESTVYFADYDMSQVNILLLAKGPGFHKDLLPPARLFGEYFGSGLSSIVFQEIREARGLAYSAGSAFTIPPRTDESHYIYGFVGTQADKLKEATEAMLELMNDMPKAQEQFDLARESIRKKIQTERIIKTNIFWTQQRNLDLGIDYDNRKDAYDYAGTVDLDSFNAFFEEYIKGNNYSILILGSKGEIDMNVLGQLGVVKEVTLEELFNY